MENDIKRYEELYKMSVARVLDKMDIDPTEYLNTEESKEYKKLGVKLDGQCPFCGEENGDCECFK